MQSLKGSKIFTDGRGMVLARTLRPSMNRPPILTGVGFLPRSGQFPSWDLSACNLSAQAGAQAEGLGVSLAP
jgi:hypothetical protein